MINAGRSCWRSVRSSGETIRYSGTRMADQENAPPAWRTFALRLTVFPSLTYEPAEWWEHLVGRKPDESTRQRSIGLLREQGAFDGGILSFAVAPGRVDWFWSVDPEKAAQAEGVPELSLGTVAAAAEKFWPRL